MLEYAGQTDAGKRRDLNEDYILLDRELFLVCDGMGGHKAGEVASKLAAEAIASFVERSGSDLEITWPYGYDARLSHDANRLRTAFKLANRAVYRRAASSDEYTGMGTTVAAVIAPAREPRMTYSHVGDSRIYLIRRGEIVQLTRDDSLAALLGSQGEGQEPVSRVVKNVLTKALGARDDVEFEVLEQPLEDDDHVILCSDGLTNMLPDSRIAEIVAANPGDLGRCCAELVAHANLAGGRDNISVIVLRHSR
jgi:serine/threonine protein phosphatase PrpC